MKVRYLKPAQRDIDWFLFYCSRRFPEGKKAATAAFAATLQVLKSNPLAGREVPNTSLRMFPILKTPYAFYYRPTRSEIRVAHVWDMRAERRPGFKQ